MEVDAKRVSAGFTSLEGGMNSGRAVDTLPANQFAYGVNVDIRGGYAKTRPGFRQRELKFLPSLTLSPDAVQTINGQDYNKPFLTEFETADLYNKGQMQGVHDYVTVAGETYFIASIGGYLFKIELDVQYSYYLQDTAGVIQTDPVTGDVAVVHGKGNTVQSINGTKLEIQEKHQVDTNNPPRLLFHTVNTDPLPTPPEQPDDSKTIVAYQDAGGNYFQRIGDAALIQQQLDNLRPVTSSYNVFNDNGIYDPLTDLNQVAVLDFDSQIQPKVWMEQADVYLVIQNQQIPKIWDGITMRRAKDKEVPVGGPMAYGQGRLWVASGRTFAAGDINGGPTSVIDFTENTFLNEGGSFTVPWATGDITGMSFTSDLDKAVGGGDFVITTVDSVFLLSVPTDRDSWKNLTYPIQTVALKGAGCTSHQSLIDVNSDMFFRSSDGLRSLILAQRQLRGDWGQTPMSMEMDRVLSKDNPNMLQFASCVRFDNRLLMTTGPVKDGTGAVHNGIMVLDFHLVGSMRDQLPPAYSGVWTGLRPSVLASYQDKNHRRAFAFSHLNCDSRNDLWEITTNEIHDVVAEGENVFLNRRIEGSIETPSYRFPDPGYKRLGHGDISMDQVVGRVGIIVKYRPDQLPYWLEWEEWEEIQKEDGCYNPETDEEDCINPDVYDPGYRPRLRLPDVSAACLEDDGIPVETTRGYQFSARLQFQGHLRIKAFRLHAYSEDEDVLPECRENGEEQNHPVKCDDRYVYNPTCPVDWEASKGISTVVDAADYPDVTDPGDPYFDPDVVGVNPALKLFKLVSCNKDDAGNSLELTTRINMAAYVAASNTVRVEGLSNEILSGPGVPDFFVGVNANSLCYEVKDQIELNLDPIYFVSPEVSEVFVDCSDCYGFISRPGVIPTPDPPLEPGNPLPDTAPGTGFPPPADDVGDGEQTPPQVTPEELCGNNGGGWLTIILDVPQIDSHDSFDYAGKVTFRNALGSNQDFREFVVNVPGQQEPNGTLEYVIEGVCCNGQPGFEYFQIRYNPAGGGPSNPDVEFNPEPPPGNWLFYTTPPVSCDDSFPTNELPGSGLVTMGGAPEPILDFNGDPLTLIA